MKITRIFLLTYLFPTFIFSIGFGQEDNLYQYSEQFNIQPDTTNLFDVTAFKVYLLLDKSVYIHKWEIDI